METEHYVWFGCCAGLLSCPHIHRAKATGDSDSGVAKKMVQNYRYCFRWVETVLSDTMIPISSDVAITIALWKWGINTFSGLPCIRTEHCPCVTLMSSMAMSPWVVLPTIPSIMMAPPILPLLVIRPWRQFWSFCGFAVTVGRTNKINSWLLQCCVE